jgi:hypothetical protein
MVALHALGLSLDQGTDTGRQVIVFQSLAIPG